MRALDSDKQHATRYCARFSGVWCASLALAMGEARAFVCTTVQMRGCCSGEEADRRNASMCRKQSRVRVSAHPLF